MKISLSLSIIFLALFACNEKTVNKPNTAMDVGRDFIRTTLDGDFKNAEVLLCKDSQNIQTFDSYKNFYDRLPADKKLAYKKASYTINTVQDLNDSTSIIDYSNSYMNEPIKIKLVKQNNIWCVDFKYTSGDTATTK
jgi:hypothetical protein